MKKKKTKTERPDAAATKAFLASGGYEFAGAKIQPYTPQRQAIASEMGMIWPYVHQRDTVKMMVRVPGMKGLRPLTHYRGSFKDSIIALFLCSQPQSKIEGYEQNAEGAMSDAWAWANRIGFNQNSVFAGEALMLWIQITNELGASKGEPEIPDGARVDSSSEL